MDDKAVGGVPCLTWITRKWLPQNKKRRLKVYRVRTIILTYVVYSMFNMARRPLAVVKSKILEECEQVRMRNDESQNSYAWCKETFITHSTEEFMGFLDSVFIFFYGICLYMSGVIADSYNPRIYLTTGCLLSGVFCALLGLADYWEIRSFKFLGTILVLFGASQSVGWPVVLSSVTHWYSGKRRGLFFGFWNTHNYSGSILGIYLAGIWVDSDWMWSYFVPGFILAITGIIVYLCMVVDPNDLEELDREISKAANASRRQSQAEMPTWLGSNQSITMIEAWTLPGVIEFSFSMFFSRMAGYFFLFWVPVLIVKANSDLSVQEAAYYSIMYVVGGSIGGVFAGILVDIFKRSALVCAFFLLTSIPILFLGHISELGKRPEIDYPLFMILGLFVEAPYIVISTSVSAELSTNKLIKRNHRALSTVGGIIEGTGALGASIGTFGVSILMRTFKWEYILYLMMVIQFVATLCVSRQAYKDFQKKEKRTKLSEYWKAPALR